MARLTCQGKQPDGDVGTIFVEKLCTYHYMSTFADDGRSEVDNSLVISMEINGIMYQGVLFAHQPRRLWSNWH